MRPTESNDKLELIDMDEIEQCGQGTFDRDVTFNEIFMSPQGSEFTTWLSALLAREILVVGRNGESVPIPTGAKKAINLPRPPKGALPTKPARIKGTNGISSIGIPVYHEGDTFALLIADGEMFEDKGQLRKLKTAADMIEWYIHVMYQQRMISELHNHTQKSSYEELVAEHERVLESEKKYRELAETLEQRVQKRKKELERAQRQLVQQEKMASIGQLSAGVAHEINNPTGFVHSNLHTLKKYHQKIIEVLKISRSLFESGKKSKDNEFLDLWEQHDLDYVLEDLPVLVNESYKGTERIIRIVRSLSRFSHVDEDEMEWINVNELLDSAVELLWNEIKHKAELIKDYGNLPQIKGNPNQLSQVFVNLIINALQSMDNEGKLTLVTKPVDFGVEIQVEDNGKGMSSENLSQIFNPFFTTKPVGQGTGLGLSISYEIITTHEGDIRVESELWKGTTFYVRLPVEPGREE